MKWLIEASIQAVRDLPHRLFFLNPQKGGGQSRFDKKTSMVSPHYPWELDMSKFVNELIASWHHGKGYKFTKKGNHGAALHHFQLALKHAIKSEDQAEVALGEILGTDLFFMGLTG